MISSAADTKRYAGLKLKAWVLFAGATGTISSSFNITSVTRTTGGTYTVVFTTPMNSAVHVVDGDFLVNGYQELTHGILATLGTTQDIIKTQTGNSTIPADFAAVYLAFYE